MRAKECLAVSNKVHAMRGDVDIELAMTSEIQHREEIGAELRDMEDTIELLYIML